MDNEKAPPEGQQPLQSQWEAYFRNPAVQAGLLQFAASIMQPVGLGQTLTGRVGTALGEAGGAMGRATALGMDVQQQELERQKQQQALALREREVATGERTGTRLEQQSAAEQAATQQKIGLGREQLELQKKQAATEEALQQRKLGLTEQALPSEIEERKSRAEYYRTPRAGLTFGEKVASQVISDALLMNPDLTPEELGVLSNKVQSALGGAGVSQAPTPTAAGTSQAPAPAASQSYVFPPPEQVTPVLVQKLYGSNNTALKQAFEQHYKALMGAKFKEWVDGLLSKAPARSTTPTTQPPPPESSMPLMWGP